MPLTGIDDPGWAVVLATEKCDCGKPVWSVPGEQRHMKLRSLCADASDSPCGARFWNQRMDGNDAWDACNLPAGHPTEIPHEWVSGLSGFWARNCPASREASEHRSLLAASEAGKEML